MYLSLLPDGSFPKSWRENGKRPAEVRIRLEQNNLQWDPSSRPENQRFNWTKADEEAFGKLTVADIKVNYVN